MSSVETDRGHRFQVHHFYVVGIADYLKEVYGESEGDVTAGVVSAQQSLPSFGKVQTKRDFDRDRLSQFLTLAWGSELQLRLSGLQDASVLRYSNAWAPVHAYYAVYMSAQAWFAAMRLGELVDNHTGSLNLISNQIHLRSLFPMPWNVSCRGSKELSSISFSGYPEMARIYDRAEPLSRPSLGEFWPRFGMLLYTTRERRLKRNIDEWKRQRNRQRVSRSEKERLVEKLPATTLFDFFWRLRVRANYRDVKAFLMSSVEESWHQEFYKSVLVLTECTCTLLQCLAAKYVGKKAIAEMLGEFVDAHRTDLPSVAKVYDQRLTLIT